MPEMKTFFLSLLLLTALKGPLRAESVDAGTCAALKGGRFGTALARVAQYHPANAFNPSGGRGAPSTGGALADFCQVLMTASPTAASRILIEVWLPDPAVWNGKFLGTGNGGFGGTIRSDLLVGGLKRNYATANTDMGTFPASVANMGYDAGTGNPEMVADWGYRSTHEMTIAAKELVAKYYGHGAGRSYFNGCSTGGHQALSEAQRYPDDYDGIIAGAPGHNRTHLHIAFLNRVEQAIADAQVLSRDKASLVSNAILAACGGKDGGAPGDRFLTNPAVCSFDPNTLLCASGTAGASCLSEREVEAASRRFGGTRNRRTNELIYPLFGIDGPVLGGGRLNLNPKDGADAIPRWVFGPQWDATTFDFDKDVAAIDAKIGPVVNAMNADLKRFAQHGGKLIMFHGWSDQVVSPFDSIVYFDRINGIAESSGDRLPLRPGSEFSRLFMAPGMGHCQGGAGPDSFGQASAVVALGDPAQDIIAALDKWVDSGAAPEEIIASKIGQQGTVLAARPLCAYPEIAQYKGHGDPNHSDSFSCIAAPEGKIEFPAQRYLK